MLHIIPKTIISLQRRGKSFLNALNSSPVLVSASKDVYTNLALEHWLFTNLRFGNTNDGGSLSTVFQKPVVLIWTDEPCVVIGRHQNPWVESTLGFINRAGLKLARRHSGGGCVYHDENNINISIIGDRTTFDNRQTNLRFLAKVLGDNYGIKCEPSKRHDLVHAETGLKISGSAAKLGRFNSYHHFTVLVDTDKEVLYTAIRQNQQDFIQTNSSLSTRSKVINLKELKPELTVEQVITDLVKAYGEHYKGSEVRNDAKKQRVEGEVELNKFREELQTWEWLYGMTPRFKLRRTIKFIENGKEKPVQICVDVNKGLIEDIGVDYEIAGKNPTDTFKYLIGSKFTYKDSMVNITQLLKDGKSIGIENLLATFLLQMVHECNY